MEDDLENIRPVIEALRRLAQDPRSYTEDADQIGERFEAALQDAVKREYRFGERLRAAYTRSRAAFHVLHRPKTSQEALSRIQATCNLSPRQVRLIKDVNLIQVRRDGRLHTRCSEIVLKPERAAAYLFAIGCLFGLAIGSLISETFVGLALILRGFGLGIAIGSIAGFVCGRSFLIYPIVEKLKTAEHWMSALPSRPPPTSC